jgi:hypothetical protein
MAETFRMMYQNSHNNAVYYIRKFCNDNGSPNYYLLGKEIDPYTHVALAFTAEEFKSLVQDNLEALFGKDWHE